ncbi:MAG: Rcs stress response system protein RcsF [Plesiomonas sp.]|uniref:Rcs stress response system protein RcsF n=1 Tax=Plesiomonas sp. TaxID=2486279 RepID=UPI003F3ACC42
MQKIILVSTALLLGGCATHYNVDSNLNPQNVKTYFAPTTIAVYEKTEQLNKVNYQNIGRVQGEVCQASDNEKPASIQEARNTAQRHAQEMGGNALLLNQCLILDNVPGCKQLALCQGSAIIIAP